MRALVISQSCSSTWTIMAWNWSHPSAICCKMKTTFFRPCGQWWGNTNQSSFDQGCRSLENSSKCTWAKSLPWSTIYYKKFVPPFSELASPLHKLLWKEVALNAGISQQQKIALWEVTTDTFCMIIYIYWSWLNHLPAVEFSPLSTVFWILWVCWHLSQSGQIKRMGGLERFTLCSAYVHMFPICHAQVVNIVKTPGSFGEVGRGLWCCATCKWGTLSVK